MLETVGLNSSDYHKMPHQFSGGQIQRLLFFQPKIKYTQKGMPHRLPFCMLFEANEVNCDKCQEDRIRRDDQFGSLYKIDEELVRNR